jgi:hypothetical protein
MNMFALIACLINEDLQSISSQEHMSKERFMLEMMETGSVFYKNVMNCYSGNNCTIHWQLFDNEIRRSITFIDGTHMIRWNLDGEMLYNG